MPQGGGAVAWLYGIAKHQLSRFHRRGVVAAKARKKLGLPARELSEDDYDRIEELEDVLVDQPTPDAVRLPYSEFVKPGVRLLQEGNRVVGAVLRDQRTGTEEEVRADAVVVAANAFGTPQQKAIRRLSLAQADHLLAGKELGTGSMRQKVEAAADFVRAAVGERIGEPRAIVAELSQGLTALQGEAGTTITRDGT